MFTILPLFIRVASPQSNYNLDLQFELKSSLQFQSKITAKLFIIELYRIENSNFNINLETKSGFMTRSPGFFAPLQVGFRQNMYIVILHGLQCYENEMDISGNCSKATQNSRFA